MELIRFRFTPARGHSYGPPQAAQPHPSMTGTFAPVEASRAFLNQNTAWVTFRGNIPYDPPQDTYDGADIGDDTSLGVVDDTCGARVEISLRLPAPVNKWVESPNPRSRGETAIVGVLRFGAASEPRDRDRWSNKNRLNDLRHF
ncbi:MAG TPA: hypothetical protein VHE60_14345 [Pyrinomonadaceae bacterium]|nr:hypothetical protein [Pyrinomonadaceae bacterium]